MGLTRPRFQQIKGSDFKNSCRVVATTNISLANGAPATVDGVNLQVGDRVLVTAQTTASQNGIYVVATLGSGENGTWARANDAKTQDDVTSGLSVPVTEGSINDNTTWKLITDDPITLGSTNLEFQKLYQVDANSYGDANVATFLASGFGSNTISTTGNVTAGYFIGDGSQLTGISGGGGGSITVSGTAPVSPLAGDVWIDSDTAIQYVYINDGNSSQWVEMEAQVLAAASSAVDLSAVDQNIIPAANVTYNLGSSSYRWNDIYLANSTIYLGEASISSQGEGLVLPNSVSIGSATLDASSGTLSLPSTITIGNSSISESAGTITLPANTAIGGATVATPRISSIDYPDNDTATDPAGGQTLGIVGSGFQSGASVILDGATIGVVTFVSDTRLEIVAPAKSAGSYTLYVINSDGGTGIFVPGVQYSGVPVWSSPSAGSLGTVYETANVAATFSATSDSSVTYSLLSGTLPPGTTLNANTGVLSGTANLIAGSSVTYSFTVRATDAENQDTDRAFSLTIDADSVTWASPTDGDTVSITMGQAGSTTLSAASAAGDSITYSANTLPSGLTLSGDTITGTANTVGDTSVALTATADITARSATVIVTFSVIQISSYIATPTATPAAFGDAFEGGFYTGLIWNQVTQSATSTTIGTGEKTFTVTDDMAATPLFYQGQSVEVRSRANPATARMIGTVAFAGGTTLTVNVTSVDGSGTLSDWSVMAKYRVIVAPKSSGENSSKQYKNVNTAAPSATGTLTEGLNATLAMVADGSSTVYPAAHFCNDLSIGGYADWYLPARDELELIYRNLKSHTSNNYTSADRLTGATPDYKNLGSLGDVANTHGLNNNSYPQGAAYTPTVPAQTSAVAFRTGGAEALAETLYWSSTEYITANSWFQRRQTSRGGLQAPTNKSSGFYVRAVRRSII